MLTELRDAHPKVVAPQVSLPLGWWFMQVQGVTMLLMNE